MEYQKKPVAVEGFGMYQIDTNGIVYAKNGKPLKYSINHKAFFLPSCHTLCNLHNTFYAFYPKAIYFRFL